MKNATPFLNNLSRAALAALKLWNALLLGKHLANKTSLGNTVFTHFANDKPCAQRGLVLLLAMH